MQRFTENCPFDTLSLSGTGPLLRLTRLSQHCMFSRSEELRTPPSASVPTGTGAPPGQTAPRGDGPGGSSISPSELSHLGRQSERVWSVVLPNEVCLPRQGPPERLPDWYSSPPYRPVRLNKTSTASGRITKSGCGASAPTPALFFNYIPIV